MKRTGIITVRSGRELENGAMPFGTRPGTSLMPGTPGFAGWVTHCAQGRSWFADA